MSPTVGEALRSKTVITSQPGRPAPLSDQERKELLIRLRETVGQSRLKVEGPPDWYPYWARVDDTQEMSRLESLGFRAVVDDPVAPRYRAGGFKMDGTYVLGDVILMELPREVYEFLDSENERTSQNLITSARQTFENEAAGRGVPTFEPKPAVKEAQ